MPARVAARRGRACLRDPDLERGRARLPASARQPADRRHRHERQDDDDRAARRDPPRGRPQRRDGRERRPRAHATSRRASSPARGSSASSRASSSRTSTTFACDVAVLLNLEPDHLDRHGTFEAYQRREAPDLRARTRRRSYRAASGSTGIEFSADDPLPAEPLIPGAHNRENAAAATAAARAAGVGDEAIAAALRSFPGVPHRLELVRELERRALRQRLEGDEHRRRAARRRGVRRAAAPDPRRLAQGRGLRPVRARAAGRRSARST